ncbi:putative Response regulator PleD (Includes: Diguanylate cyclase) [Desulfamplus magnetovallimortis]|uniref:Putative Response regulator PleD n=1 Tax=Desulfamplus magnetovallimortis TaxID=1246637 RepID=A0A1W1H704_9BACT|nr:diguanylate cyclase [Desulfamplus magnetovallimortis]SLM28260.1 putative Response regulator PleD (Includes: Diguanylate cyclase) [Desulfamplus magnetovallimortis]
MNSQKGILDNSSSERRNRNKGGNILIVDDNPQNLRLLLSILNSEGYKVRPAPSGPMALEAAFSNVPDLILLDIMMPEMDGFEVCRKLKENEKTSSVPVIFISAMDDIAEKLKGFELGAVDYITKPFQPREISARVNTHLSLRRVQKLLEYEIVMRTVSENTLKVLSKKYDLILAAAGEGILGIDNDCRYTFVNPAAAKMLGCKVDDLVGKSSIPNWYSEKVTREKNYGEDTTECPRPLYKTLREGAHIRVNHWNLWRQDGTSFDAELICTPIMDENEIEGAVVIFSDISERKRMEKELKLLATTDSLTGVSNRRFFMEGVSKEINLAMRHDLPVTFLMMDIDEFKNINDTYGHQAGDDILKNVSQICMESLRANDLFGRVGGEEFAALLPATSIDQAKVVAERIRKTIEESRWNIGGVTISSSISIGMAPFRRDKEGGVDALIKDADEALYYAKNSGRNCIKISE